MQRVHVSPAIGKRRVENVTRQDIERLARSMLDRGLAPKTVRNVMTFLHAVFALAVDSGWAPTNSVAVRLDRGGGARGCGPGPLPYAA